MRIEGKTETLFEGSVRSDGHEIRAASDDQDRRCDGLNGGRYQTPGPTPTAAAVDAMAIVGEGFDGRWHADFDDYFITAWGSDRQDLDAGEYWGLDVNHLFSAVGGCQQQVDDDDEVLWAYDAFGNRPRLGLYPAGHGGGGQVPVATVKLGTPFEVEVEAWKTYEEGMPPESPRRGDAVPYGKAVVARVRTGNSGFERIRSDDPLAAVTDAGGRASIVFDRPGWHRIKATATDPQGRELVIRSNRIDLCVYRQDAAECGEPPADVRPRLPPAGGDERRSAPDGREAVGRKRGSGPPARVRFNRARLDRTVRYLQDVQNADGGFGAERGRESGQAFSAWVALALAAAGINPRDQRAPGGSDVYSFLVDHFEQGLKEEIAYPRTPTTAFERELMVVNASGTDPHDFGGYDLVAEILARARPDGSFPFVDGGPGTVNSTVFAIVSLAPVRERAAQRAVRRAAAWLAAQQARDGSWHWGGRGGEGEVDMTGAAVQALNAAGRGGTAAERQGLEYLRQAQAPDGGFPAKSGEGESNVASSAWAVQALWSAGESPEAWLEDGKGPLSYMASLQQRDGHIRWKASEDANGVWMTAYVTPAFAGQAWPIPEVPRSLSAVPAVGRVEAGGLRPGGSPDGVIAGGGGRGAALFSRPQPQSRGQAPGGARQVDGDGLTDAASGRGGGRQVEGAVIGAPGLRGAGADAEPTPWLAAGIAGAVLLLGLMGSRRELLGRLA